VLAAAAAEAQIVGRRHSNAEATLKLCPNCFTQANPKLYTKGDIGTEIVLWLMFLVPGVFYSVWRHASRYKGCPSCGAAEMIPLDSPRARQLLSQRAST
jgi:hypothetical protein